MSKVELFAAIRRDSRACCPARGFGRAPQAAAHRQRIYERLIDEHEMHDVSYQVVRAHVADRKPKIRIEAGRGPVKVFFPQARRPGAEAEVDFGEVAINLRGELVTCVLFAFRLSFSGEAVHKILRQVGRRHSWEATSTRSPRSAVSRPARSATAT